MCVRSMILLKERRQSGMVMINKLVHTIYDTMDKKQGKESTLTQKLETSSTIRCKPRGIT
eukprot:5814107-Prorocentrum_lima.AAC.1